MRWCVVAPLAAACGGADVSPQWGGAVDTLPGGAIRVTNPSQGMWQDDASWRLVPALVLGEADGAEATVFGSVSGLEVDDAGRIYVLDRQANALRIFTPDGVPVRSVGRSGGGPGEYASANGLEWLAPDTLVVVDQQGGRYTVLTREGVYVRSVPRQLGFYGWIFAGGLPRRPPLRAKCRGHGAGFAACPTGNGSSRRRCGGAGSKGHGAAPRAGRTPLRAVPHPYGARRHDDGRALRARTGLSRGR